MRGRTYPCCKETRPLATAKAVRTRTDAVTEQGYNIFLVEGGAMNLHVTLGPLIALIAGILILVVPRLLNFIVAIYLIIVGLLGLFGAGSLHL